MSELGAPRLWMMRIGFALLVCMILFFHLLPLDITPSAWVGPNLLLCFALAWSLRRPEFVPLPILAALLFLADLLLQRPPGLWSLCALLACENLKSRTRSGQETGFLAEWLAVAIAATGVTVAYRLGLAIALLPLPTLGLALLELVMTVLFYPVAAVLTHWAFGVRRAAPGDLDVIGGRL